MIVITPRLRIAGGRSHPRIADHVTHHAIRTLTAGDQHDDACGDTHRHQRTDHGDDNRHAFGLASAFSVRRTRQVPGGRRPGLVAGNNNAPLMAVRTGMSMSGRGCTGDNTGGIIRHTTGNHTSGIIRRLHHRGRVHSTNRGHGTRCIGLGLPFTLDIPCVRGTLGALHGQHGGLVTADTTRLPRGFPARAVRISGLVGLLPLDLLVIAAFDILEFFRRRFEDVLVQLRGHRGYNRADSHANHRSGDADSGRQQERGDRRERTGDKLRYRDSLEKVLHIADCIEKNRNTLGVG